MALYWRSGDKDPSFELNQNVFVQIVNGKHEIVAQQNSSTPGIIFKNVAIQPNTTYTMSVFGHAGKEGSAFLAAYQGSDILYSTYTFLPTQENSTTTFQFKTNNYMESITIGVCFTSPNIGDTFTVERISLEPTIHVPQTTHISHHRHNTQFEHSQKSVRRLLQWTPQRNVPAIQANQNTIIHKTPSVFIVTTHQDRSTPGALIRNVPVQPNTEYRLMVTGYSNHNNAFLLAYSGKERLTPNYILLPQSRGTVEAVITTTSMRVIHIGVCFTRPQMGQTFYIEEIVLDATVSPSFQTILPDKEIVENNTVPSIVTDDKKAIQTSTQQIAQAKMISWSYFQYTSLICQATHVELAEDVCQSTIVSANGTPAVFMDVHIPTGKNIRFTLKGYTSYPDFRLCVFSPTQRKELITCTIPVAEVMTEQFVEFNNESDTRVWVGITCTKPKKGYTAFIESMDIREVSFVDECFADGSVDSIQVPYVKSLALSVPSSMNELLESPGMLESPGICEDEESCTPDTHEKSCIRPRQIPEEIKNIEVQIFSLIDSINNMNVNLTKTEKKLIEKIKSNTA